MIYTTTCTAEEFEAIREAAILNGLQVTAAPGFIYKKGKWIVGNTLEDEAHFNARIESISLTPAEFRGACIVKEEERIRSLFVTCENILDREQIVRYFIEKGYKELTRHIPDGRAVCVVPAEKTVMVTFEYIARQNAREGYTMIDFETFKTIVG